MSDFTPIVPAIRAEIEARLARLAAEEGVRLLLAIESGSRAWGFPSPDSDFDVRFLYVRARRDYLALEPVRDVIERPVVDEIDLNGWDIRKALGLMLRNNSVLSEWMESPIRYAPDDPIVARLGGLVDRFFDPRSYALHYANLGTSAMQRWLGHGGEAGIKRYFYALRPALAIRALRMDSSRRPPMQLQRLMAVGDLPQALSAEIDGLVALKAETREAGLVARSPRLETLVASELDRANEVPARPAGPEFAAAANELFLELVES